jgi:hypothetical protein
VNKTPQKLKFEIFAPVLYKFEKNIMKHAAKILANKNGIYGPFPLSSGGK